MTRLSCNVESCAHYCDHFCCLSYIQVGSLMLPGDSEDTCCLSFVDQHFPTAVASAYPFPSLLCEVECTIRNCLYYHQGFCSAGEICVDGCNAGCKEQTECASFQMKY